MRIGERQRFRSFGRVALFGFVYACAAAAWWACPLAHKEVQPVNREAFWRDEPAMRRRLDVAADLPWLVGTRRLADTPVSCNVSGTLETCELVKKSKSYLGACIDETTLTRDGEDKSRAGCMYGCLSPEDKDDEWRASVYFMSGDWRLTTLDCNSVRFRGKLPECLRNTPESMGSKGLAKQNDNCAEICLKSKYSWYVLAYIIGMLYMFGGLAIVCDEFFVPSLEYFSEHLGMSNDVAGATCMAAGGSMPELLTSFQGTFYENDVGFSTIVGSAVFNVLFVIGVCGMASEETLQLTWWPLARDVSFYIITLITVLAVFAFSSPNVIETWEALILLLEYICYCTFMVFNKAIHRKVCKCFGLEYKDPEEAKQEDKSSAHPASAVTLYDGGASKEGKKEDLLKPTTFRQGIFTLLTQNRPMHETCGVHAVTMIKGNLEQTFKKFDNDGNGLLDEQEILKLLMGLGMRNSVADEARHLVQELRMITPRTKDGRIGFESFKTWYLASEARVEIEISRVFDKFDKNNSGTIERDEIKSLMATLGHIVNDKELDDAIKEILDTPAHAEDEVQSIKPDKADAATEASDATQAEIAKSYEDVHITYNQFERWYLTSLFWKEMHAHHQLEGEVEDESYNIDCPIDWPPTCAGEWTSFFYWFTLYPLAAAMYVSIPDIRNPNYHGSPNHFKWAMFEFGFSLAWIAALSIMLYEWTCVVSNTVGIPTNIASVTLLAGGTSIPDLLSSYVVAKQGHGDMAVSSSIGSNIFDVTIGLPLPWLCYCLFMGKPVRVESDSIGWSLLVLIVMLASVILAIMFMGWKMNKKLGGLMMVLYVVFLVQHFLKDVGIIDVNF